MNAPIETEWSGVLMLSDDDFDHFLTVMQSHGEPTEAAKRGAELLRSLYSEKAAG